MIRRALLALLLCGSVAHAGTWTDWMNPSADTFDTAMWSSTFRVYEPDDSRSGASASGDTMFVNAFGFDGVGGLPLGATVVGIEISVEGYGVGGASGDREISVSPGCSGTYECSSSSANPQNLVLPNGSGSESLQSVGGAADTFAMTLSYADATSTDFGVIVSLFGDDPVDIFVDHIKVRLNYTEAAGGRRRFF